MYICTNYSWYFSMNYLPAFLQDQYGVQKSSLVGALYKGGPLLLGMAGCFIGGWLTDRHIRATGDRKWGRRIYGMLGHGLAGLCMFALLAVPYASHFAWVFAIIIAFSGFFNDLTMGSAWAACQDVGKRYSAIVSGFMNMIGNLGGAVTTYVSGWLVERAIARSAAEQGVAVNQLSEAAKNLAAQPGWELNFILYGAVYLLAVVFWLMLNANKSLDETRAA
jgi:MFS family permease